MTNPPQQPEPWQEPSWSPAEQQQPPQQQPQPPQPSYPDPYGNVSVPTGYPTPPGSPTAYPTPPGYAAPSGYTVPAGQAGYPGYGYGAAMPASAPNNGMAVAAMVVSIVGALGLCGYGLGGYIGIVGAILGHVARRQIKERGEAGAGMALAGIIVGWIAGAIAVIATIIIVIAIVFAVQHGNTTTY